MGKKLLITGGSGLVGSALTEGLQKAGHTVSWLTRSIDSDKPITQFEWDISAGTIDAECISSVDVIIHLAGTSINAKRWNRKNLEEIKNSRVKSAKLLYDACLQKNHFPAQYISGSALGYYGFDAGDQWLPEDTAAGTDFLAEIVNEWEKTAIPFREKGCKVAWLRTGIVLSNKGGALEEMLRPIKLGLGSPLGSGKQYVSWIHETDQADAILHIITNDLVGAYNLTAPEPVTNKTLMKALANLLGKPFFMPPVPAFVLKIAIGPMTNAILGSVRCSSKRLENSGFRFKFAQVDEALKDLFLTVE